ncbi:uncharacterized protein LOC128195303 [Vigna angularis]|uniref:uncharacterized protein LOC128195303 n=1 Tax=Phaseolus angularis TaxID=3914 RepID=UPI0022B51B2A|nr:uncharacterized protein LOC128195303 [Vigna angularis]
MTLPLGGVLHMLEGESSLSCIDKLYKSISELSPDRYLRSQRVKEELVNAKCAPQFAINGQILPIGEVSLPKYCFNTLRDGLVATSTTPSLKICDPKSCIGDSCSGKGFPKGPSTFMVTDDLVVTPMSSISAVSYLNRSQVPFSDLEERVISVGVKEGLAILKASLTSTSALTQSLAKLTCDCETTVAENATRSGDQDHTVSLKVLVDKEKNKVVFTEAGKDFLDVLLSFLTLPLVTIARLVAKESNVADLLKFSLISRTPTTDLILRKKQYLGSVMYMVTDHLVMTPMSSINVVSYLKTLNVPRFDLEERVTTIGSKEGLGLSKASLTSTFALTERLKHLIRPIPSCLKLYTGF